MAAPAPRDDVRRQAPHPGPRRALLIVMPTGLLVFLLMLVGYLARLPPLLAVDRHVLSALAPYAVPDSAWVRAQDAVSVIFGPATFRVAAAVVGVVLLMRGRVRSALFALVSVGGSGVLVVVVKGLVRRPRPVEAAVDALGSSFPSGHAVGVMAGVASFALLLWPVASRYWRRIVALVGAALVASVGFSRLALAVHHLSDVVAGFGLALAWVALVYAVTRPHLDFSVPRPVDRERTIVHPE